MKYARIIGTGSYLPEKILTNDELSKTVETNDAWIRERTGISQRHIVADGEYTSDLALHASREALEAAGMHAALLTQWTQWTGGMVGEGRRFTHPPQACPIARVQQCRVQSCRAQLCRCTALRTGEDGLAVAKDDG